ncbi:hypothetical protein FB451DRAFT_1164028 [Mycena latifolia]|nr:hypothetical protein FB451DRAFT_1164028 [Mycena latifolia]
MPLGSASHHPSPPNAHLLHLLAPHGGDSHDLRKATRSSSRNPGKSGGVGHGYGIQEVEAKKKTSARVSLHGSRAICQVTALNALENVLENFGWLPRVRGLVCLLADLVDGVEMSLELSVKRIDGGRLPSALLLVRQVPVLAGDVCSFELVLEDGPSSASIFIDSAAEGQEVDTEEGSATSGLGSVRLKSSVERSAGKRVTESSGEAFCRCGFASEIADGFLACSDAFVRIGAICW